MHNPANPRPAALKPLRPPLGGGPQTISLKVISALLSYPTADMVEALEDMADVIRDERLIPPAESAAVLALIEAFGKTDLVELQQRYVSLFDRGRALSLHLFEHIHGESRDRGQAMVDLMNVYRDHGFELDARELPDYVPLFLEYLAQRPHAEGRELLEDAMPVLSLIGARLVARQSPYHVLFGALQGVAGVPSDIDEIRASVAAEGPDESVVNMDKIWEEEAVTFMDRPSNGCGSGPAAEAPVQWVQRPKNASL